MKAAKLNTDFGDIYIFSESGAISKIYLPGASLKPEEEMSIVPDPKSDPDLQTMYNILNDYFNGIPVDPDAVEPYIPNGNEFRYKVWKACSEIPYGSTISYGALARRAGYPHAARAVGTAMAKNPLPILVPCHRVVTFNGKLGGYGGGEDMKRELLIREGVIL